MTEVLFGEHSGGKRLKKLLSHRDGPQNCTWLCHPATVPKITLEQEITVHR